MHNFDRVQQFMESDPSLEMEFDGEGEFDGEFEFEAEDQESGITEEMEAELASELLGVQSEEELDQFLGKLFRKVTKGAKKFLASGAGKSLMGTLKGVAKVALPAVGGALGTVVAPGLGTAVGASLGGAAGNMFGLELEGLSEEDQEWEVARRVVRLAADASTRAVQNAASGQPTQVARQAVVEAARVHAPGLAASLSRRTNGASTRSGKWYRRGNTIVLVGV